MIIQIIYYERVTMVLDMAKPTKIANLWSLRGTIDFENQLVLEKTAETLLLEQSIFYFTYFQLSLGMAIIRGIGFYRNPHKLGVGWGR